MGSRINIPLTDLLQIPEVRVELRRCVQDGGTDADNLVENLASVTFAKSDATFTTMFDYTIHNGKVELSKDFNFFRYTEGSESDIQNKNLMRFLYKNNISFTIHH